MDLQAFSRKKKLSVPAKDAAEDGDFVQLRAVRERRKQEEEATGKKPALQRRMTEDLSVPVAIHAEEAVTYRSEPKSRPTTASKERTVHDVRQKLFAAVDSDDKTTINSLIYSSLKSMSKNVSDIRDPKTDQNILHYALENENKTMAMHLINLGQESLLLSHHDVLRSGIHGRNNSLHIATDKNDIALAKVLLEKAVTKENKQELLHRETAVDIKGQRPRLFSCLHLAAYHGHADLVKLYLDSGTSVNHLNGKKDTALLWASRWGHNKVVAMLLDRGADPNVENDKGSTALYWAVRYEYPDTVELLIKKGKANPNTKRKLGLVAPIIVAAAFGNTKILSILLQHPDIDMNIRIRGGEMAIHHAAREGCYDVVEMLLKHGMFVDEQDEIGDTPLLLAAKSGHVDIVYELIQKNANINHRNHEGNDAWYFAIENEDNSLLQTIVSANPGHQTDWRQPLCIAASNGRCDKVHFLLKLNMDPMRTDLDGNTFLHHAAMTDKYEVISQFHEVISVNTQNNKGSTPLHIACFRGYTKTIDCLLECKAKADIKNKKGETPLHVAAYSSHISAETVRNLVDYTVKTHAWESLNAKDFVGNNCLHIAGHFAKPDVMWEFRQVRFKDRDQDGLTPLHEAVRQNEPEALDMMLDIYEAMNRDARINEQSYANCETVLHLAADEGHAKCVKRLIEFGADIMIKDVNGNTVLHRLTIASINDHHNLSRHLDVFDTIFDNIVRWWCIKKNIPFPEEENQDDFQTLKREASLFVTNNILNNDGLSVLDEGFKTGAPEILSRLLMMPGVTMFEGNMSSGYTFDINSLTPRTENNLNGCCSGKRVAPLEEKNISKTKSGDIIENRLSGLEWLLTQSAKSRAAEILDLPPIRMIEQYYTSMVARTFALLMILHITYMSVLTYVGVDLLKQLRVDSSNINSSDPETILLYAVVPLEPALILIYVIYTLVKNCFTGDVGKKSRLSRKTGVARIMSVISSYIFICVCVLFAILIITWIILFSVRYAYQDYFLASGLVIGWLLTISFTRGIRLIHYFYRMLISMIIRDVLRFIIVYLFVIMAFAFGFHVLFQISPTLADTYEAPGDTLFLTFNMMIGMEYLFEEGTVETEYNSVGRSAWFMKVLYLMYIILGTIVLLNLLIAMMNDSYSNILKENQVTWRIESVSLGVDIESSFPISSKLSNVKFILAEIGKPMSFTPNERWHINMTDEQFQEYMREIDRKYTNNKDAVSKRLEELEDRTTNMEKQMSHKLQNITDMLEKLTKDKQE